LLEDIISLCPPQTSIPPSSRKVKEAVIAGIGILKAMPSDRERYLRADRSVHLFLLTSQLDDGAIYLLPEVFMGQMRIHILGIGLIFWPRNEMGSSRQSVPLRASGPKRNSKVNHSEQILITVKEIVSTLITGCILAKPRTLASVYARQEIRESWR